MQSYVVLLTLEAGFAWCPLSSSRWCYDRLSQHGPKKLPDWHECRKPGRLAGAFGAQALSGIWKGAVSGEPGAVNRITS
jgi:hypothetical protein